MNIHSVYKIFFRYFRKKRMRKFEEEFHLSDETHILDVGGSQINWQFLKVKPHVRVLNLSKPVEWDDGLENFTFEAGNALHLKDGDLSVEIAYSNSVIEHLHTWENQKQFAKEILRIGKRIYVQTPAKEFFIEPHVITPFIHWLPLSWQSKMMRNFTVWGLLTRPSQEFIDAFLAERRLLSQKEFKALFPGCGVIVERFMFLPKSYIAVKNNE
ncbi:MAG TPA: hypothetical protein VMM58_12465 [Bacteroidota bacterium]|nr:hypothetical protein [Bacteroidota bacterium]